MVHTAEDFTSLLSRIRQGDKVAQSELMNQYADVIQRIARLKLGHALRPHLDSVDLVQSVHRTLLIGLRHNKFDISTPEKLVALALTLVRRKVARYWRKLKHQPGLVSCPATDVPSAQTHLSCGSRQANPAEAALLKDEFEHVLQKMDEVDRRCVELRLEGYSTAEVARLLGVDPGFLRVRLGRLRKRLSEAGVFHGWL